MRDLKGISEKGERQKNGLQHCTEDLKFYNSASIRIQPGDFKVFIAANSRDTKEAGFYPAEVRKRMGREGREGHFFKPIGRHLVGKP